MSADAGFAPLPDGGRLAYTIHGAADGRPWLLLVRPLGGSASLWGELRDRLAEHLRVIAYDYRGSGHSSSAKPQSTRALAADARALLDYLDVDAVHVFGLSLGGMVSTWIGADDAARVRSLCLASAPLRGFELSVGGIRQSLALARCFFRRDEEVEVAIVRRILSERFRRDRPDEVRRISNIVRAEALPRRRLVDLALVGLTHDGGRAAPNIACPTLVLRGERDALVKPTVARDLASAIVGSSFETVEDAGHDLSLEAPVATAERILGLVRSARA